MLLGNLQGDSDIGIEQATDELYVHHLLSRSYQARYEEDANSPDFRLYRSSEYMAGIEVLTLFPESDFVSKVSRNGALVDEINRRVRPVHWYVGIDVIDWRRQPRVAPWSGGWKGRSPPSRHLPRVWPARTTQLPSILARMWSLPSTSFLAVRQLRRRRLSRSWPSDQPSRSSSNLCVGCVAA